ncbi:MAG: SDR family NAD(P)-dependent oxidoreductase [Candidatus Promineifilaceae bacterium]|jgi:NAD(P)-dependent dehydrogenase (short-subunit alcohol dehydrogenase family)
MPDFKNKIVAITGAAGNLGKATAIAFHDAGARLAVIDRKREVVQELFGDLIPEGPSCYYASGDLTDSQSVSELVDGIIDHFGRIDVLANIAGGYTMGPPVHETPIDTWDFMLNLNARTVFLMSRAVIPFMLAQGYGKIVNIGAEAALAGRAHMAPYIVSKSAVIRLTESMAAELRQHEGINVNCVLPGTIDTPRNRKDSPDADFSKWVAPEALADVILFLASEEARAVNGAALPVHGRS